MSWEIDSERNYTCPCGKGTYTVVYRSDDWNRHEENWRMNCTVCSAQYVLYSFYSDRDMAESYCWLKRDDLNNYVEQLEQQKKQGDLLLGVAKMTYLLKWERFFSNFKTKKSVWMYLNDHNLVDCSLNTFYRYVAETDGLKKYIRNLFNLQRLQEILQLMNVEDHELIHSLNIYRENEKILRETEKKLRRNSYS